MTKSGPQNPEPPSGDDPTSLQLDAIKAIGQSASFRWEKRRVYEWQLSISIWTAAAAFTGVMLNRQHPLPNPHIVALCVGVCGLTISILHAMYTISLIKQTMADVHIQHWSERKMYELAFKEEMPFKDKFYPKMTRFRLVQVPITMILLFAAIMSLYAPK